MELKIFGETKEEEVVKVVPSHEDGALIIDLDEDTLVDIIGLDSYTVGKMGLRIAVGEITLPYVDKQEYPAIRDGNAYVKRQLVKPISELEAYSLHGEISINLSGSSESRKIGVRKFQEVSPYIPES